MATTAVAQRSATLCPSAREKKLCLRACKLNTDQQPQQVPEGGPVSLASQLQDFHVKQLIGEGTGGQVYLAEHAHTHLRIAIKVARKTKANTKAANMLRREHTFLHELKPHKHLVQGYDFIENADRACLLMQFAEQGDLFEYVRKMGGLKEPEAWRLFKQLMEVVSHIHAQHVCHRDIKPENIFLDKEGNVLLGDFGLASKWSPFCAVADCVGSLDYAAPEVLRQGTCYKGPEVDMWSCGAVLFMMLTGRTPFYAASSLDVFHNIQSGRFDSAGLSPNAKDLIQKLLNPDPLRRATMYEVLNHPWMLVPPMRARVNSVPLLGFTRVRVGDRSSHHRQNSSKSLFKSRSNKRARHQRKTNNTKVSPLTVINEGVRC
ncbi:CBL-interacting serine/threonine-protein kinase 21 [Balamuthia mandrillaris]